MTYNLTFDRCYLTCRVWKEKESLFLRNFISKARLGREITFNCYCNILFDSEDKRHERPIVTELETFSRNKVNGLLYDVLITEYIDNVYNKCLIYHTEENPNGFYGYLLWHTDKNIKPLHIAYIESTDSSDLVIRLNNSITNIKSNERLMESSKKIK